MIGAILKEPSVILKGRLVGSNLLNANDTIISTFQPDRLETAFRGERSNAAINDAEAFKGFDRELSEVRLFCKGLRFASS